MQLAVWKAEHGQQVVADVGQGLRLVVTPETDEPSVRFMVVTNNADQGEARLLWSGYRNGMHAAMSAAEEAARTIVRA